MKMTDDEMKHAALFRRARRAQKASTDPAIRAQEQEKIDQARAGLRDYWRRANRAKQLRGQE